MAEAKPFVVVVWGDSIAAGGWPAMAERSHNVAGNTGTPIAVINEGVGGMPASRARSDFEERVAPHKPDLVIIQFGFNDIRHDGSRGELPLSTPDEFREHLTHMVKRCRDELGAKVLVQGNHATRRGFTLPTGLGYDQARVQYSAIARDVARAADVPFVDMADAIAQAGFAPSEIVNEDGVHLTPTGNHAYGAIVASEIGAILRATISTES